MPKNRDTPALFELVRSTGIKRPHSAARENPLIPDKTTPPSKLHPKNNPAVRIPASHASSVDEPATLNQSIRLPLGYIFVAIAAVILLLVIAYSVGYARGNNTSKAQIAGFLSNPNAADSPGSSATNTSDATPLRGESASDATPQISVNTNISTVNDDNGATAPAIARANDTRRTGLNYIIVERFKEEEADRVADYLVGQGIDAMVLPSNNRHLRQVVLRQGFAGWSSNREGMALLGRIKKLGRLWKSQHDGTKNFDQAYGNKFGR